MPARCCSPLFHIVYVLFLCQSGRSSGAIPSLPSAFLLLGLSALLFPLPAQCHQSYAGSVPRETNLCLHSSAHSFAGCRADQSGRCWSVFTALPPLTIAFQELPRRNPALPSNSISTRFRSSSMPFPVVPSQIQSSAMQRCSMPFRRCAVRRSPAFLVMPFPRYADQCFSKAWVLKANPTRICAVLFRCCSVLCLPLFGAFLS